jgi:BirA family biotin operon repressor/biotin-[acetyl-CoA-carboxylase] ligase
VYKIPAKTLFVGKKLIFLTSCHSTNEEAYAIISSGGLPEGSVIITDEQTKGRGQMGNTWESEPQKNLTFSIVFKPDFLPVNEQFRLTQAISLGILDAFNPIFTGFSIKWPNDIYYDTKKVGGILIQNILSGRKIEYSIAGIGLNINQHSFENVNAISLARITGRGQDREELLEELVVAIEQRYIQLRNRKYSRLHEDYMSRLYRYGEDHLFRAGQIFSGRIIDVRPSGELVMDTRTGERDFWFKEVEFI